MRIKTIIAILVTILLTVVIMQNTGRVRFSVLFFDFYASKLIMLLIVAIVGFVLGWLVGRPKKAIRLSETMGHANLDGDEPDTLSDEDRDYISK